MKDYHAVFVWAFICYKSQRTTMVVMATSFERIKLLHSKFGKCFYQSPVSMLLTSMTSVHNMKAQSFGCLCPVVQLSCRWFSSSTEHLTQTGFLRSLQLPWPRLTTNRKVDCLHHRKKGRAFPWALSPICTNRNGLLVEVMAKLVLLMANVQPTETAKAILKGKLFTETTKMSYD